MFDKIKKFVSFVATEADRVQAPGSYEFKKKNKKNRIPIKKQFVSSTRTSKLVKYFLTIFLVAHFCFK